MASTRLKGKKYYARWRTSTGKSAEKGGFRTQRDAYRYAVQQENLEQQGINTKPSETNFTVFDFVDIIWKNTLTVREATKHDYQRSLNSHILPRFGDVPMKNIKPAHIEAWIASLKKLGTLSDRTIEKHANLLAAILKKAVDNGYLHKSPFASLKRDKAEKKRKAYPLLPHQVDGLLAHLAPKYHIMVWLGYWTGMRPSELLGLTYDRLDFENSTITIDRQISRDTKHIHAPEGLKTKASNRVIGFPEELKKIIRQHVDTYGLGPNQLLLQNRLGGVLRYHDASALYRKAARAIGLEEGAGMHQLRHTCVSILISKGAHPKQIQNWVGHSSIVDTLDVYGHLFPNSMGELADKLDEFAQQKHLKELLDKAI